MHQSRKLAFVAALGLLVGAPAAHASVIYDLTLTPTSGVLIGGTGTFTVSTAPLTTTNAVSNYSEGLGTLETLSFTIDGQTFGFAQQNLGANALVRFTSGVLDDITYGGTSNGFTLDTTAGYVFYLQNNAGDTIGSFTATEVLADPDPDPPSVPEPASLTLFGAALAGLGFLRRRRSAT